MNKLESFNSGRIYWAVEQHEREAGDIDDLHLDDNLFYIKSEVDKVTENKDKEIASLKDSIGKLLKAETKQVIDEVLQRCIIYGEGFVPVEHAMRLVAELRHQKYKRCLAMAQWCDAEADVADANGDYDDMRWYQKWHYRWLDVAVKFKEVK